MNSMCRICSRMHMHGCILSAASESERPLIDTTVHRHLAKKGVDEVRI